MEESVPRLLPPSAAIPHASTSHGGVSTGRTSDLQPDSERLHRWSWISFTRSGIFASVAGALTARDTFVVGQLRVKALTRPPSGHRTDTLEHAAGVVGRRAGFILSAVQLASWDMQ